MRDLPLAYDGCVDITTQIGDYAMAAQHVAKSVEALASQYGPDGVELGPEYLKLAQLYFHSRQVRCRCTRGTVHACTVNSAAPDTRAMVGLVWPLPSCPVPDAMLDVWCLLWRVRVQLSACRATLAKARRLLWVSCGPDHELRREVDELQKWLEIAISGGTPPAEWIAGS